MEKRQVGVRFPTGLVERLDVWLDDLNRDRRILLNRSELIVGVLDWAAETRPEWERRVPAVSQWEVPPAASPPLKVAEPAVPPPERFVEPDAAEVASSPPQRKPQRRRQR